MNHSSVKWEITISSFLSLTELIETFLARTSISPFPGIGIETVACPYLPIIIFKKIVPVRFLGCGFHCQNLQKDQYDDQPLYSLNIESYMQNIAVSDNIILSFNIKLASFLAGML